MPPGALAGFVQAVLLAVCLFSPVVVGLSVADNHGFVRENERQRSLWRMGLEGRATVDPGQEFEGGPLTDGGPLFGPYEGGAFDGDPDTHVYGFEKAFVSRRHYNFPSNARVALLLRGASFRQQRNKSVKCDAVCTQKEEKELECVTDGHAFDLQKNATDSLVENVIVPLEEAGNTVDVILTDHDCIYTSSIAVWIGDSTEHPRVKMISSQPLEGDDGSQQRNLLFALDSLVNYSGGKRFVETNYNYVFVMRHDTVWKQPINEWPDADFSKVIFPYKCPYRYNGKSGGVHDLFMLMPSSYFEDFYKTVEWKTCFKGADGHQCLEAMAQQTGELSVGVAIRYGKESDPLVRTVGPFDYWYTYGRPRQTC